MTGLSFLFKFFPQPCNVTYLDAAGFYIVFPDTQTNSNNNKFHIVGYVITSTCFLPYSSAVLFLYLLLLFLLRKSSSWFLFLSVQLVIVTFCAATTTTVVVCVPVVATVLPSL